MALSDYNPFRKTRVRLPTTAELTTAELTGAIARRTRIESTMYGELKPVEKLGDELFGFPLIIAGGVVHHPGVPVFRESPPGFVPEPTYVETAVQAMARQEMEEAESRARAAENEKREIARALARKVEAAVKIIRDRSFRQAMKLIPLSAMPEALKRMAGITHGDPLRTDSAFTEMIHCTGFGRDKHSSYDYGDWVDRVARIWSEKHHDDLIAHIATMGRQPEDGPFPSPEVLAELAGAAAAEAAKKAMDERAREARYQADIAASKKRREEADQAAMAAAADRRQKEEDERLARELDELELTAERDERPGAGVW